MTETVLYMNLDDKTLFAITTILAQLDVKTEEITIKDANQTMGYLLNIDGYLKNEEKEKEGLDNPFLLFAFMTEQQIDLILEIFERAQIAYIPYKAVLTNENVEKTLFELYNDVKKEYDNLNHQIPDAN